MLKIASWNDQGLRSPNKCMRVLRHLRKLKVDIALLHRNPSRLLKTQKFMGGEVKGSPAQGKMGGVVTLIHKCCPYTIQSVDADDVGRRITIHITPQGATDNAPICITNIYAHNSPGSSYFKNLKTWFTSNINCTHIIGGDFNSKMWDLEDRKGTKPLKPQAPHLTQKTPSYPLATFVKLQD